MRFPGEDLLSNAITFVAEAGIGLKEDSRIFSRGGWSIASQASSKIISDSNSGLTAEPLYLSDPDELRLFAGAGLCGQIFVVQSHGSSLFKNMISITAGESADTSPTPSQSIDEVLNAQVQEAMIELYAQSQDEEGGATSPPCVESLIAARDKMAIRAIDYVISSGELRPSIIGATLELLGRIEHPPTANLRRFLLERNLFNRADLIRDYSGIGLSLMDDPRSIASLELAVRRETHPALRKDFEQILAQLRRKVL
jgi:hypothetical protein